jgi:hypothetical protein
LTKAVVSATINVIYQQLVQKENKMMPLEKKTDCWEVDPTEGRTTAAWMLIDPHYAGRVLVCGGRTDIEVGDEISYRMNGNYDHFMDSERNDYEVVKVTFKKQDKDNSDSYWD